MTALLLLSSALAAPPHSHSGDLISDPSTLYESVLAHFDPAVSSPSLTDRFSCGTGLVMQVKDHWQEFTTGERAELTALLAPWKEDLLDVPSSLPPPPPGVGPVDTCWGQFGAFRLDTPHFGIEWDGNNIDLEDVENLGQALEESWTIEIDELGWRAPNRTDDFKMLVYIDGSNYSGAYTTVEACDGAYMPYIVTGNGIFYGDWYQDLAAHEFNHAAQFGYGYAHEFYFWEATATYIEELTYPEHDAWAAYIRGYTQNPWIALTASSQSNSDIFSHMYAMSILNFYLDEYVGGPDLNRELWEYSSKFPFDVYTLWLPDALEGLGYDWGEIYAGFVAANTVMDYDEGSLMGRVDRMDWVHELPLAGASERTTEPENLGQNYWRISGEAFDADEPDLALHFEGELGAEWLVMLVGTTDSRVERMVVAEAVEGEEGEETWEALMSDWGVHEDVWVVMSPTSYGYEPHHYAFDVWDQPAPEPEPVEEESEEEAGRPVLGSCATVPATGGMGWMVVVLFGLGVRRRDRG
jgi:hypothetical protein